MRKFVGGTVLLLTLSLVGLTGTPTASAQVKPKDPPAVKKGAPIEKPADPVTKAAATGLTFQIYKDSQGEFRFRIEDAAGTKLAMAIKGYKTKDEVDKIIATLRSDVAKAKLDDQSKGDSKAK